jgi:ring-1,2-phenylacetyl-CoA epoxidase subunit PaaC
MRRAADYHCSQFVELPIGDYDFSLIRHFLFDMAELVRFESLRTSSYRPLADLATKYYGEIKYHAMHARTWLKRLGNSNEDAIERLQVSLDYAMPFALGIFEPSPYESMIIDSGLSIGEKEIQNRWLVKIQEIIGLTHLELKDPSGLIPQYGGRIGQHTKFLEVLLDEMSEVFKLDPEADW